MRAVVAIRPDSMTLPASRAFRHRLQSRNGSLLAAKDVDPTMAGGMGDIEKHPQHDNSSHNDGCAKRIVAHGVYGRLKPGYSVRHKAHIGTARNRKLTYAGRQLKREQMGTGESITLLR